MWRQILIRELAAVLLLKLAALFLIWYVFFAETGRQELNDQAVGRFLLGASRQTPASSINLLSDTGVKNGYRDGR